MKFHFTMKFQYLLTGLSVGPFTRSQVHSHRGNLT